MGFKIFFVWFFVTFTISALAPLCARAEESGTHLGAGMSWSVQSNLVGIQVYGLNQEALSLYGDIKFSLKNPQPRQENVSRYTAENVFGDTYQEDAHVVTSGCLGGTKMFYKAKDESAFYGFGGLGFSQDQYWRKYYDRLGILGNRGNYWIKDGETSGLNFQAGAILSKENYTITIGLDTLPSSLFVGVGYLF